MGAALQRLLKRCVRFYAFPILLLLATGKVIFFGKKVARKTMMDFDNSRKILGKKMMIFFVWSNPLGGISNSIASRQVKISPAAAPPVHTGDHHPSVQHQHG